MQIIINIEKPEVRIIKQWWSSISWPYVCGHLKKSWGYNSRGWLTNSAMGWSKSTRDGWASTDFQPCYLWNWMFGCWDSPAESRLDSVWSDMVTDLSFWHKTCACPWNPHGSRCPFSYFCDSEVYLCALCISHKFTLWAHFMQTQQQSHIQNLGLNDEEEKKNYGYKWC